MKNYKLETTIFLCCFFFIMVFQGSRGLWERDEGRYTAIALNMLRTKDFEVPRLNEDVVHFAKPPLTYWAIAGGLFLIGENEWGARLPNAIAFSLTVLLIFLMAKIINLRTPILSPIIYATSIFPYIAANFVTTDTLLTLFEALGVYGFLKWWKKGLNSKGLIIMWVGFGLGFLTKGPPSLLPLISILVFVSLSKGKRSVLKLFTPVGVGLFLAIGFSWFIWMIFKYPGIIKYFVVDEFFKRIATGAHHRNPQWYKPFIIYLPILIFGTLPWTYFLKNINFKKYKIFSIKWWKEETLKNHEQTFLLLWLFIPLIIFFIAKSRLPLYILPLFIPLSLFLSSTLPLSLKSKKIRTLLVLWIAFLFSIKFAMSKVNYPKDSRAMAQKIKKSIHPIPKEVAFVNEVPFWGLSLYLKCEVEELTYHNNKKNDPTEEFIGHEIQEDEKGVIYVIKDKKRERLSTYLHNMGVEAQKLAQYNSYIFFLCKDKRLKSKNSSKL